MGFPQRPVLTNAGRDALLQAADPGMEFHFTEVVLGSGAMSGGNLEEVTGAFAPVFRVPLNLVNDRRITDGTYTVYAALQEMVTPGGDTSFIYAEIALMGVLRDLQAGTETPVCVIYNNAFTRAERVYLSQDQMIATLRFVIPIPISRDANITIKFGGLPGCATLTEVEIIVGNHNLDPNAHLGRFALIGHRHSMDDIDGLWDYLNGLSGNIALLFDLVGSDSGGGGTVFYADFVHLSNIIINDGIYNSAERRIEAGA